MSEQMCEQRRERLRALMREQGIEALLISHAANRYYLSGFELHDVQLNESAGRLIVMADGKDWILTDSRYLDAVSYTHLDVYKRQSPISSHYVKANPFYKRSSFCTSFLSVT